MEKEVERVRSVLLNVNHYSTYIQHIEHTNSHHLVLYTQITQDRASQNSNMDELGALEVQFN